MKSKVSDKCEFCSGKENVDHVLMRRKKFKVERDTFKKKWVESEVTRYKVVGDKGQTR